MTRRPPRSPLFPYTTLSRSPPREKHRRHAIGIGEHELRRIFDVVTAVTQAAGPRAHRLRRPRDVEQLVDQVRAVIEQHAAASVGAPAPPWDGTAAGSAPRVGSHAIDAELREIPAADHPGVEPPPQA